MIERKFIPLVVAVFVLTAGISGSATLAVLSDSETVNVQVSPDGVNATVVDNATAPTEENLTATETQNATELTVDEVDGLIVELEPTDETTISPGETAEYDVVVKGASEGINGYGLKVGLTNPEVARFDGFDHRHDLMSQDEGPAGASEFVVSAGAGVNGTITTGLENPDSGETEITLGTLTVAGESDGQTSIEIVNNTVGIINETDHDYRIGARLGSQLTVNATEPQPIAKNDSYTTSTDEELSVMASNGVLSNDQGDSLSASASTGPSKGNLTLESDGSFTYEPAGPGTVQFTYEARDGNGGVDSATVTIQVESQGS